MYRLLHWRFIFLQVIKITGKKNGFKRKMYWKNSWFLDQAESLILVLHQEFDADRIRSRAQVRSGPGASAFAVKKGTGNCMSV